MKNTLTVLFTLCIFSMARSGNQPSSGYGPPNGGGGGDYTHEFTYIKDNFDMHPLILRDADNNFFQIAMMKTIRKKKKKPSKFDFDEHYISYDYHRRLNDDSEDRQSIKKDHKKVEKIESRSDKFISFKGVTPWKDSKIQKGPDKKSNNPYLRIFPPGANPYEFGYKVKDDYSGSKFHQQEASDGNQVRGEYRVELPDGRTQIVTYWADWQTGFHADVKYEGKATFPPNPPKYGPPTGGGNGGYNYPAPSAPGNSYGAP